MKTHIIKCIHCEEKEVTVTVKSDSNGVHVRINRCKKCESQMTMDEVFPHLKND